jgi:hypothetical protein
MIDDSGHHHTQRQAFVRFLRSPDQSFANRLSTVE